MCLFCDLVSGKIPSKNVLENDEFVSFYDIAPRAKIHVLVIPKKHFDSFNEIDGETMSLMTKFIQQVVEELNIKESGYRVVTNVGKDGRQEVNHIHFHILGGERLAIV